MTIGMAVAIVVAAGSTMVAVRTALASGRETAYEEIFRHPNASSRQALESASPILIVRPTRYPDRSSGIWGGSGKAMYVGATLADLFSWAYGIDRTRVILPDNAPKGHFDFLDTLPTQHSEALRNEINKQFGLVGRRETRSMDVLILAVNDPSRLESFRTKGGPFACYGTGTGDTQFRYFTNAPLSLLAQQEGEGYFEKPCIDRTDPKAKYDFSLQWEQPKDLNRETGLETIRPLIEQQIRQLGLELVPSREQMETLVVEKAY